jgi:hypothetical protein
MQRLQLPIFFQESDCLGAALIVAVIDSGMRRH